jgi:hypothetical protein
MAGEKRRAVSFTVTEFEYEEILMYARTKGHGGQYPVSNFAHYAVLQQMKIRIGENHPSWRGGTTPEDKKARASPEYKRWVKMVLRRDHYRCQICGSAANLNAHHIKHFVNNPKLRTEISNGLTLCESYHREEHKKERILNKMLQNVPNGTATGLWEGKAHDFTC